MFSQLTQSFSASVLFFLALLFIPLFSVFWHVEWLIIKLNWLPLLIGSTACFLIAFKYPKREVSLFLSVFTCCAIYFLVQGHSLESIVRIMVSFLPLLVAFEIRTSVHYDLRIFFFWYALIMLIPFIISILQLTGKFPFYDEGPTYEFFPSGRISGGYMKPNNLCAYFFPLYLYGFHLVFKGRRKLGVLFIVICLAVVFISALRTAIVIYTAVLVASFFIDLFNKTIEKYYRFFLPLVLGVLGLLALYLSFHNAGPMDGLRYRLPMWQAHADHFFNSDLISILFGFGDVELPANYRQFSEIRSFNEAHNNTIRILITFGLFGFCLYCLFLRSFVLRLSQTWQYDPQRLFIVNACILYYLIYSITNEPAFYPSIAWSVLLWVFLNGKDHEATSNQRAAPASAIF
jgi:hypothetical protein